MRKREGLGRLPLSPMRVQTASEMANFYLQHRKRLPLAVVAKLNEDREWFKRISGKESLRQAYMLWGFSSSS